jgi:hypothetical protein
MIVVITQRAQHALALGWMFKQKNHSQHLALQNLATRRDGRGSKQNLATTTWHAHNRAATGEGLDGALVHGAASGGVWLLGRVCFRLKLGLVHGYLSSFFNLKPNLKQNPKYLK